MKSGWVTKKLGEVCELINGKNQSAVANPNGKYPIYGSGGVMGRASDFRCPAGCTIIGRKGSINNPLFVNEEFWNVDTAYALSPKDVEAKWVYYFCRSFDFAQLDCGTTIPSLTSTLVKGIDIPIPPLAEQKRIVAKIDAAFEKIDTLKANAERNLANAKELFQSALDEAMRPKKGWVEKRLGEVGEYRKGPFGSALTKRIFVPKDPTTVKVYEQKNAIQKSVTLGEYYITREYFTDKMKGFEVLPGDVIVSCAGTIGETFIMPEEMEQGIINQALMRMRINPDINKAFFL